MMREDLEKEDSLLQNAGMPVATSSPFESVMAEEAYRLLDENPHETIQIVFQY